MHCIPFHHRWGRTQTSLLPRLYTRPLSLLVLRWQLAAETQPAGTINICKLNQEQLTTHETCLTRLSSPTSTLLAGLSWPGWSWRRATSSLKMSGSPKKNGQLWSQVCNSLYPKTLFNITTFIFVAESPTGQLPMLEVNGTKICQSLAIAHYLAKRAGLCGKDDLEAAQAEMICLTIEDIVQSKQILCLYATTFLFIS